MTLIGAVDVGSNSVLTCIAEAVPSGDFRVAYESFRTTRLGEGMQSTGRLTRAGIRRTLEALKESRRKFELFGVAIARAVATAAAREAVNPEEFLVPAEEALGLPVDVISGDREAELTFLGAAGATPGDPVVVLDVGGRSTELILARDGHIERTDSLPVGAVRLRDSVPSEDTLRSFAEVVQVIPTDLDPADTRGRRAIAVGGTATTLAAMRLGLNRYDADRVEGLDLTRDEILMLVERVHETPAAERAGIPGLAEDRTEIIVSGGLILAQILEHLGIESMSVSSRGLRHGLLRELAGGNS